MNAAAAYEGTENLLRSTVWDFVQKHGGDFQERLSESSLHWMEGMQRYDPDKGAKFSTWIRSFIWWRLQNSHDKDLSRREFSSPNPEKIVEKPHFSLENFLSEISEDAQLVAKLALRHQPRFNKRNIRRRWLWNTLAEMGWGARRIRESFLEIGEALIS